MRFTLVLVAVLAASAVLADSGFDAWSKKHNKVYGSWAERQYREVSLLTISVLYRECRFVMFSFFLGTFPKSGMMNNNLFKMMSVILFQISCPFPQLDHLSNYFPREYGTET